MGVQVSKEHYNFLDYIDRRRINSYYHQLRYIYSVNPTTILDVGMGNGFIKKVLRDDFKIKTLDIDKELKPDYHGSVDSIPAKDGSFDLISCFQILEHLPYEKFDSALKEIHRVTKKDVLISLPICSIYFKWEFTLNLISPFTVNLSFLIPRFYKKHKFDGQHHWEVGKKNYSRKKIREAMLKYFLIKEEKVFSQNMHHIFYQLEKKM